MEGNSNPKAEGQAPLQPSPAPASATREAAGGKGTTSPPPPSKAAGGEERFGTKYMGPPAPPSSHPSNQQAATWTAGDDRHHPYVLESSPVDKPGTSPMETILDCFESWAKKTESLARNVWENIKTAPSISEAAWGKLSLTAKAISEGGFESLFRKIFPTEPNEKLKKTFACYLSTTTGPVAGTLYLSSVKVAFCSDRPLSFRAPSGQEAWSYYKVMIPLYKIANVIPVTMNENEKYIQIVTVDRHEFWFMGFVNHAKASKYLLESVSHE